MGVTFPAEPFSHGPVVEAHAYPGEHHAGHDGEQGHGPRFVQRVLVRFDEPKVEDVHQRIVHNVEREGNVAEKLAHGC